MNRHDTDPPRRLDFNAALWRPETVAGCEKAPLGITVAGGIMFGLLGWFMLQPAAGIVAALLIFGGVPLLRRIGKADPRMFAVYAANLPYRAHYVARASAFRRGL